MCGRFDQNDLPRLLTDFAWADELVNRSMAKPSWNVAPTTSRPLLRFDEDGTLVCEDVHWGYQPFWAKGKIPVAINTRREKISGKYWAGLLKIGRVIVPADGWYEWTGEKGEKQPWHIHREDRGALFFAGLAGVTHPDDEHKPAGGFTIVTDDAQGGMVDVHDRRPIVLNADDAKVRLDPATPPDMAEELARVAALGPELFEWFQVNRAVGNVRNQGPELAQRQG